MTSRGRWLGPGDRADRQPVVVINQELADELWPGEEALGREIRAAGEQRTIVGIVADVPFDHLGSVRPKLYVSHGQLADDRNWALSQVVKTDGRPLRILGAVGAPSMVSHDHEHVEHLEGDRGNGEEVHTHECFAV